MIFQAEQLKKTKCIFSLFSAHFLRKIFHTKMELLTEPIKRRNQSLIGKFATSCSLLLKSTGRKYYLILPNKMDNIRKIFDSDEGTFLVNIYQKMKYYSN